MISDVLIWNIITCFACRFVSTNHTPTNTLACSYARVQHACAWLGTHNYTHAYTQCINIVSSTVRCQYISFVQELVKLYSTLAHFQSTYALAILMKNIFFSNLGLAVGKSLNLHFLVNVIQTLSVQPMAVSKSLHLPSAQTTFSSSIVLSADVFSLLCIKSRSADLSAVLTLHCQ